MSKLDTLDTFAEPLHLDLKKKTQLLPENVFFELMHNNLLTGKQQQTLLKPEEVFNERSQLPEAMVNTMECYYSESMLPMSVEKRLSQLSKIQPEQLKGCETKQCNIICHHAIDEEYFKKNTNTADLRNCEIIKYPKIAHYKVKRVSAKKIHLSERTEHSNFAYCFKFKISREARPADVILQLTNDEKYRDTILYAGEHRLYCHMHLLATYSQYFLEHKFCRHFRFPAAAVTSDILNLIYTWMLKRRVKINRSIFVRMFKVAHYLRIPELLAAMWKTIDSVVANNELSALSMYNSAVSAHETLLRDAMILRIHKTFAMFVGTPEFINLDADELHRILESDQLAVNSEMEILYAVVHWLSYRWPSRLGDGVFLLECVRFRCMDARFLCTLKIPTDSHVLDELLQWASVQAMLCDALFHNAAKSFGRCSDKKLLEMFGSYTSPPRRRLHAYNKYVSFHHNVACKLWEPITDKLFKKYLHVSQDRAVVDITVITRATCYADFRCCSRLTKSRLKSSRQSERRVRKH